MKKLFVLMALFINTIFAADKKSVVLLTVADHERIDNLIREAMVACGGIDLSDRRVMVRPRSRTIHGAAGLRVDCALPRPPIRKKRSPGSLDSVSSGDSSVTLSPPPVPARVFRENMAVSEGKEGGRSFLSQRMAKMQQMRARMGKVPRRSIFSRGSGKD